MAIRIQLRRDREEFWVGENAVLRAGEVGIGYNDIADDQVPQAVMNIADEAEREAAKRSWKMSQPLGKAIGMKIGDGITPWNTLAYVFPFPEIKANGRAQRDISTFGAITVGTGNPQIWTNPWDLLDQLMHPYVPPTISLTRSLGGVYEMGTQEAELVLSTNYNGGTFNANRVQIIEITNGINAVLGQIDPTGKTGTFSTTLAPFSINVKGETSNSTQPTAGRTPYQRLFQANVRNSRVTPGNDSANSNIVDVRYAYPSYYGISDTDIVAGGQNIFNHPDFVKIGTEDNIHMGNYTVGFNLPPGGGKYIYFAYPKYYGNLSGIFLGTQNILASSSYFAPSSDPGASNGSPQNIVVSSVGLTKNYSNVEYYVYKTRTKVDSAGNPTGFAFAF